MIKVTNQVTVHKLNSIEIPRIGHQSNSVTLHVKSTGDPEFALLSFEIEPGLACNGSDVLKLEFLVYAGDLESALTNCRNNNGY